jgi:hypothetical protein
VVAQLKEYARHKGITLESNLKKADIIAKIEVSLISKIAHAYGLTRCPHSATQACREISGGDT